MGDRIGPDHATSKDSALLNFKKVLPQIDHNSLMTIMAEIQAILDKATTPNSTETKPGVCGPKSSFEFGSLEKLMIVVVLP